MLAACGGGTAAAPSMTTSCLFSGLSQMIYPIPGATSVPDIPAQVVFATSQLFPASFQLRLATTNSAGAALAGQAAVFTQITAAQVPQPSATLQISNPYYEAATFATPFSSGTQYAFFNDSLYSCTPTLQGSFTAQ